MVLLVQMDPVEEVEAVLLKEVVEEVEVAVVE
jgi:hypothetical protein